MNRAPDLHRGYCFTCGAEDVEGEHVCPDPQYGPLPPPKPIVKRWDPIAGLWVWCVVENGKAWEPKTGRYTEVKAGELNPWGAPFGEPPLELEP